MLETTETIKHITFQSIGMLVIAGIYSISCNCSFPAPGGPSMRESKAFFGNRVKQEAEGSSSPPLSNSWSDYWEERFDYFRKNDKDYKELIDFIRAARASNDLPPI